MSTEHDTRPVPGQGESVMQCPHKCSFDEIETGTEGQSFMAIVGSPYQFLRCGECGFNDDRATVVLANNLAGAISNWNTAVSKSTEGTTP